MSGKEKMRPSIELRANGLGFVAGYMKEIRKDRLRAQVLRHTMCLCGAGKVIS
jgi:hypothetical protein